MNGYNYEHPNYSSLMSCFPHLLSFKQQSSHGHFILKSCKASTDVFKFFFQRKEKIIYLKLTGGLQEQPFAVWMCRFTPTNTIKYVLNLWKGEGWNAIVFVVCVIHGQPNGLESHTFMLFNDLCLVWLNLWGKERVFPSYISFKYSRVSNYTNFSEAVLLRKI